MADAKAQASRDIVPEGSTLVSGLRRGRALNDPGLDLTCTKVAVDFQNLSIETADATLKQGLQALTDACGADAAFIALVDGEREQFSTVYAGRSVFAACNPEVLRGRPTQEFPWLTSRLDHLRLLEICDTDRPTLAQAADSAQLAALNIGGLLAIGFNIGDRLGGILAIANGLPNPDWSADLRLTLKLIGVSCASGLERLRLVEELATVTERNLLVTNTANDGLWDYNVRDNDIYFSPRWRAMLGYGSEDEIPEWRNLVHPDDMARVQTYLRDHLEGQTDLFESVHRMRHASGEWRWVQSRVKGLMDGQGRLKRLVGVETDITERKLYEEALFREKESARDNFAVYWRWRCHHRWTMQHSVSESCRRGSDGLEA